MLSAFDYYRQSCLFIRLAMYLAPNVKKRLKKAKKD